MNWNDQFFTEAFFEKETFVSEDVTYSWKLYIVNGTNKVISEGKRVTSPFAACWLGLQTDFKWKILFKEKNKRKKNVSLDQKCVLNSNNTEYSSTKGL